mgnify:CR=1 FL=1
MQSMEEANLGIAWACMDLMSRLTSQKDSGTLMWMPPESVVGENMEASDL